MDETAHIEERIFAATAFEVETNGTGINWRYWVEQMPTLTAAQAARLMSALDPDMHNDLQLSASIGDTTKLRKKAEMLQRLAIAQGRMSDSPKGWLLWARQHRFMLHDGFVVAVESLRPVERTPVLVAHAPFMPPATESAPAATADSAAIGWKQLARDEARRIRKEREGLGRFPNLEELGDEVAELFRKRRIFGPNGHALTGAYIKRHALQGHGITNDADRLRSTLKAQGK